MKVCSSCSFVVGAVAGWLAGQIMRGAGYGLIGDLIIGVIGALIGEWLMPQLGLHIGSGIVGEIINATIGALSLLFILRLVRGGGRWGRRWWRSSASADEGIARRL
jgi:uncharacterized membrane protein YeaQ/YmgE (transglycosylase-associated protein family)